MLFTVNSDNQSLLATVILAARNEHYTVIPALIIDNAHLDILQEPVVANGFTQGPLLP